MGRPEDDNEFGLRDVRAPVQRAKEVAARHESHGWLEKTWSFTKGAAYAAVALNPLTLPVTLALDPRFRRVELAAARAIPLAPQLMLDESLGVGQALLSGVLPMLGELAKWSGGGAIVGGAIGAVGGLGVLDEATIPGGILFGFEAGLMIGGFWGLKDLLLEAAKHLHTFINYSIDAAELAWYAGDGTSSVSEDADISAAAKLFAFAIAELWWVILQALIAWVLKKAVGLAGQAAGAAIEGTALETALAEASEKSAAFGKPFTNWFKTNFKKIRAAVESRTRKLKAIEEGDSSTNTENLSDNKPSSSAKPRLQDRKGDVDSYGELKKTTGDGSCDRDHQPSKAALLERAAQLKGDDLTPEEKTRIINDADAVVVPKDIHQAGPTYGAKNNPALISSDASDLSGAASRDADAMVQNAQTMDPDNLSKYQTAADEIKGKTNTDYDNWLNARIH